MPPQTIADVLTELDAVIAWARAERQRAGYFAVLYRQVTARVDDGIRQGRFEDGARMERLDVVFANRYLDALARYRRGEPPPRSWAVAFRAAETWSPLVLQHLLLGINAHINLDLGIAAAETAPGSALPALKRDFDEITTLLREMLDDVQDRIGRISPWLWLLDHVGARTDEEVFSFVLARAREFAWRSAEQLVASPDTRDAQIDVTDRAAALVGEGVLSPRFFLRPVLLTVRLREPSEPAEVIEALGG